MGHVTEDVNGTNCATSQEKCLHIIKYEDWTQHHHNSKRTQGLSKM